MIKAILTAFLVSTGTGPIGPALDAADPPVQVRAAFIAELGDANARLAIRFDPRLPPRERWIRLEEIGDTTALDDIADRWQAETRPDDRLFAHGLRLSLGRIVEAEDLGLAWKVHFKHAPGSSRGILDAWAEPHLSGFAWIDPDTATLLRVDYSAPKAFPGSDGQQVQAYTLTRHFKADPASGLTFSSSWQLNSSIETPDHQAIRSYSVRVTAIDVHVDAPDEGEAVLAHQQEFDTYREDVIAYAR